MRTIFFKKGEKIRMLQLFTYTLFNTKKSLPNPPDFSYFKPINNNIHLHRTAGERGTWRHKSSKFVCLTETQLQNMTPRKKGGRVLN